MRFRNGITLLALAVVCLPARAEDLAIPVATPEPSSIVLFAGGLGVLIWGHRKFRKKD